MNLFDVLFAKKLVGGSSPFPPVIKRVTGNPVEFSDGADAPLVKCVTEIQGSQDLHGYDKPWVGGAGYNKWDEEWEIGSISPADGSLQPSSTNIRSKNYIPVTANESYCLVITGNVTVAFRYYDSSHNFVGSGSRSGTGTFTVPSDAAYMRFVVFTDYGTTYNHDIAINYPATVTTYSPYSNICPITAYTEGEIEVSDGDRNTTHTTAYPSAIYRGSEDVVNGSATTNCWYRRLKWGDGQQSVSLGDYTRKQFTVPVTMYPASVTFTPISSCAPYVTAYNSDTLHFYVSSGNDRNLIMFLPNDTSADFEFDVVAELLTPTTTPVAPTNLPIKSLSGYNHIESTTGDMVIDYITDQYQNFVDTTEHAIPSTRKGGVKALDVFMTLDNPSGESKETENPIETKEESEGNKK